MRRKPWLPRSRRRHQSTQQPPSPVHRQFLSLFHSHLRLGHLDDAVSLFFSSGLGCGGGGTALNSLLAALCSHQDGVVMVPDVVLRAAKSGIGMDDASFLTLAAALCRRGKPAAAAEIVRAMPALELDPGEMLCRLVLRSLCAHAEAAAAVAFLHEMRRAWRVSPSSLEYHAVIDALVRERNVEEARGVLTIMETDGIRPGVGCFNRILEGVCAVGDFDMVDELFDEMLLRGLVPDIATYNTYIDGMCKKGDLGAARRMTACMERAGCRPDIQTFNVVVAGCANAGQIDNALEVVHNIIGRGLRWDSRAFSRLVDEVRAAGQIARAYQLLTEILRHGCSCSSGPSALGCFIRALCEERLCSEASAVLTEMVGRSVAPDAESWKALLLGFKVHCAGIDACLEDIGGS